MLSLPRSLLVLLLWCPAVADPVPERPRSVILFIADGFGPASRTLARTVHGKPLHLDSILVGSIGTSATTSLVTDSAASATAYACGVKTYNGAIGVGPEGEELVTLLEAAEARGMATGLVSTARMTHATPASFSAHVASRGMEQQIADQQIEQGIDLMLGGGRNFFLPGEAGGARRDQRNLMEEAATQGYHVLRTREEFDEAHELPLFGLFTDSHMSYEIDRDPELEPSLAEMTGRAIALLAEKGGEEGFFLMVEAGRIDHAGHANDSAAHLHDTLAFDEAIGVALQYAKLAGNTLLVSVADHETGGLTLGRNDGNQAVYSWRPEFLLQVKCSIDVMMAQVADGLAPELVLAEASGIDTLNEEEGAGLEAIEVLEGRDRSQALAQWFSKVLSRHALTGWTTWGHTGVDIGLFAYGPGSDSMRAHHENDELGRLMAEALDLDLREAGD